MRAAAISEAVATGGRAGKTAGPGEANFGTLRMTTS
jgi:hypothetical protein